mgnify:FL=1
MSVKYHPDKNPDDPQATAKFLLIKKAYDCLIDPEAKANCEKYGNPDGAGSMNVKNIICDSVTMGYIGRNCSTQLVIGKGKQDKSACSVFLHFGGGDTWNSALLVFRKPEV